MTHCDRQSSAPAQASVIIAIPLEDDMLVEVAQEAS